MKKSTKIISVFLLSFFICSFLYYITTHYLSSNKHKLHIAIAYDNNDMYGINSYEYSFIKETIDNFEIENPHIEVILDSVPLESYSDWLYQSIIKGTTPDLFTVFPNDFAMFRQLDILETIDPVPYQEAISPSHLQTWTEGNLLYAVPYSTAPPCLLVNRNLLSEYVTDFDELSFNWIDLAYYCLAYTQDFDKDGIMDQIGVTNMSWRTAVYANGQTLFDPETKSTYFDNNNVEHAIKLALNINRRSIDDFPRSFDEEKALIRVSNLAEARYFLDNHPEIDLYVLPIPKGPDGPYSAEPYNTAFGINSQSSAKSLANDFIAFISLDEKQQQNLFDNSYFFPILSAVQNSSHVRENMKTCISNNNYNEILNSSYTIPINFTNYYKLMDLADKEIFRNIQSGAELSSELASLNSQINDLFRTSLTTKETN